ncbi:MAG: phenylalanine--tRNA ligase beta subunit-related protein [Bacteroidota bacterium]
MIAVNIEEEVAARCPDLRLSCIQCKVKVRAKQVELDRYLPSAIDALQNRLELSTIASDPILQSSRQAYKALGKDPSRYRLSAEALRRRVAQGKGIYRINNVVDLLNLISLQYGFSIGGYNADAIQGPIRLGRGRPEEPYQAIGRGALNIEGLPVLRDQLGAFGSPTSDSQRTMVGPPTEHFLMIFFSFGAGEPLAEATESAVQALQQYTQASELETALIHS